MAACHVVDLTPQLPVVRCYVHDQPAPCPHADADAPAAGHPYHVWSEPDQTEQVTTARHMTRGTRPIRIHEGVSGSAGHVVEPGRDCWCDFVDIPAG
jgi:hypothetical protein